MKIRLFNETVGEHGQCVHHALMAGFKKNGFLDIKYCSKYELCDIAVVTGMLKYHENPDGTLRVAGSAPRKRNEVFQNHKNRLIIIESAIFRKGELSELSGKYWRVGWNDFLFDRGNFCNLNSKPDRWLMIQQQQSIEIKPWRTSGDHILICMQKENDASLRGLNMNKWAKETVLNLRKFTNRNIIIRPHPKNPQPYAQIPGTTVSTNTNLYDDLKNCWAMVCYSSLSAVDAACYGIPVFCHTSNMATPIANFDLSTIEKPILLDRNQWLWNTAYCQWRLDEMENGIPQKRLISEV